VQTPEHTIAILAVVGVAMVVAPRFFQWLFSGPIKADPWGEKIGADIENAESMPVCHRCLTEHSSIAHFCPQCGAAVGEYNNLLPFDQIFSEGEVFRNGTNLRMRPSVFIIAGYLILSLSAYAVFAPVYWLAFLRNLFRRAEPPPLPDSAA
jgi:hypothetical protein